MQILLAKLLARFDNPSRSKPVRKMTKTDTQFQKNVQSPYEAALAAALDDLVNARRKVQGARDELQSAEARITELTQLVSTLLGLLPPDRAALYTQRLNELRVSSQPSVRSGPVHDNVVELFSRTNKRQWSASDVQAALADEGKSADPKAVYNVLNYLVRSGRLRRVARGQYYVEGLGFGIQLDQDIEGVDPRGGGCMED